MGLLGLVLVALSALVVVVWLFQRRLIYFPFRDVPPVTAVLPGSREVSFVTRDGLRLAGWLVPASAGRRALATVLVCNGNAGNRAFRAPLAQALSRRGLAVLLFDYRGYGGSQGSPSEQGLREDARAARSLLDASPEADPSRIVYYGESLGSAVALSLALERPPAALVLRSPFTSLAAVGRVHYPFLPVGWLLRDRYEVLVQIELLRSPLLVIAGQADRIVPSRQSRLVHDAARVPKRFVLVPGADHNDLELLAGGPVIEEVVNFVNEALAGAPRDGR